MPTIHVNISRDGQATVHGEGFPGKTCLQAMAPLEEALGPQQGGRDMHPEIVSEAVQEVQQA